MPVSAPDITIEPCRRVKGMVRVPGDKSISHRGVILGSLAEGMTHLSGFLMGEDCLRTVDAFRSMGVKIEADEHGQVSIQGAGLRGLKEPLEALYCGNSGTTMRLMMGVLAGQSFKTTLSGDDSLNQRPMMRVVNPLRQMGAVIDGREDGEFAPVTIRGGELRPIEYTSPVASAQVKSAVLFAGLYAPGETKVIEPAASRDHTERMLEAFGAEVKREELAVTVKGPAKLQGRDFTIPGDISSAAFFLVAAAILKKSEITIQNVGINPTRTGILDVLRWMGAKIEYKNRREQGGEPVADLTLIPEKLQGTKISGAIIPRLIDEIPAIAVAASFADGMTVIRNAEELRVKETDRIKALASELRKLGVEIGVLQDGLIIHGKPQLTGKVEVESFGDHRMAMALCVASLGADAPVTVKGMECVNTSFPNFLELLNSVSA